MSFLFVTLQYLLPHHWLCSLVYRVTRSRSPRLKDALIGAFLRGYKPNMTEALEPDAHRYASFNEFFTRALKPGARTIDADPQALVSPCDGTLSIAGALQAGQMLQAKGHHYSVEALLAGREELTAGFDHGSYATIYLAPYNYHRVHMPLAGRLIDAWHVPGRLFSVNAATVQRVPGLFARNERVICRFEGEHGEFIVILVGALFVGSMSTVWHGDITPARPRPGAPRRLQPVNSCQLWQPRGAELGRFNMGSTVILLLPRQGAVWNSALQPGHTLSMGMSLGRVSNAAPP